MVFFEFVKFVVRLDDIILATRSTVKINFMPAVTRVKKDEKTAGLGLGWDGWIRTNA
jgi:hypothetical protein